MAGKKIGFLSTSIKILSLTVLIILLISCSRNPIITTSQESNNIIPPIQNEDNVITQDHDYGPAVSVDYSVNDIPEFVYDVSECVDENKKYVLPDGYVYVSAAVPLYNVTNQLEVATDIDGSVFNECGYLDNARIRGILEIGESDYSFVTGLIPIKRGDKIYFSGNMFDPNFAKAASMNIAFYNANKQIVSGVSLLLASEGVFNILETNTDGYASCIQLSDEFVSADFTYVRFTLVGSGKDQIISINEPLVASDYAYDWVRKEQYIPADWFEEIKSTIDAVNSLDVSDESNLIKFIFASDIHLDPYWDGKSYTENLGKVCAEVMRACNIPFFVTGGDNCTQSSGFMPTDFYPNMQDLLKQLSPIPQKNILLSVGNHDGATGMAYDHNGEPVYYRFQLNNEQRQEVFFEWQKQTNEHKQFGPDGTYYYLDDSSTKTRYIILNSFWAKWKGNSLGYVPNEQNSFFSNGIFGPDQLEWFASEALDMPDDYAAIIVTHFAAEALDFEIFKGIVEAFNNRTVYSGNYIGEEDWQTTKISVDYENAYGEIIAFFQGHNHTDATYDYFDGIPCINITTAGAYWAVRDEDAEERVKGTSSEFSVDVVVIDRENRKIYLTRLGAGKDRVFDY